MTTTSKAPTLFFKKSFYSHNFSDDEDPSEDGEQDEVLEHPKVAKLKGGKIN